MYSLRLPRNRPLARAVIVRSVDCFMMQSYRKYIIRQIKSIICFPKSKIVSIFAMPKENNSKEEISPHIV
jgi:hypothetical protein